MTTEIPTRLSADDPDFDPNVGRMLVVALDGVEQRKVSAYDIDAGTVTRAVPDADGQAQVKPGTDEIWIEVVSGIVTVTRRD